MHRRARVFFEYPRHDHGRLAIVNDGHDVDVIWRFDGYGLIFSEQRTLAIREFDPQSKHLFVLFYLESGERESGFICSGAADVNIYKDHEKLYNPSRLRRMG